MYLFRNLDGLLFEKNYEPAPDVPSERSKLHSEYLPTKCAEGTDED